MPRIPSLSVRAGLAIVIVVVLVRSAVFVWWPDVYFDADQAVTGLMAAHVADGRAFPVFQYAQQYVLVLEAWLIAPLMAFANDSVSAVKSVPVAFNVATAVLLYSTLVSVVRFRPSLALLATLPIALPAPRAAKHLTDALGMNIEPLLFALLVWRWRERPILLGVTAAIGLANREFTLYAVAALLLIDAIARAIAWWRPSTRDVAPVPWQRWAVTLVAFAITATAVSVLKQVSSPTGPGTTFAILAEATDNMAVATSAMCLVPAMMPGDVWATATQVLPLQLGVGHETTYGPPWLATDWMSWIAAPLLALLLAFGVARGLRRAWRDGPSAATWFGGYLVLVGVQAALVYALTRCGHVSVLTMRYTLLALLAPVGAIVLALERESRPGLRRLTIGGASAWIGLCAIATAAVLWSHIVRPPRGSYRELARYLDRQGVRYIQADYWIGYHVAFLTGERVKALTNFERVHEYTLAASAHPDQVREVRRVRVDEPCPGAIVAGFYVCSPTTPTPTPTSAPTP